VLSCYPAEFGRFIRSNGTGVIKQIRLKILTLAFCLSRSLKVIGTDTDRFATYDFLLTFHIATVGLSPTVSEINGDFSRKSQKNSTHPVILTPYWFRLELPIGDSSPKTRMMGLPGRDRSLTLSLAVWIQYTNVTDRRTDTGDREDGAYA